MFLRPLVYYSSKCLPLYQTSGFHGIDKDSFLEHGYLGDGLHSDVIVSKFINGTIYTFSSSLSCCSIWAQCQYLLIKILLHIIRVLGSSKRSQRISLSIF